MISTNIIILRKTPFSETSLIVASLSPEYGRLDFLLKGARKFGAKKFPEADIFREFAVHFRQKNSTLHTLNFAELVGNYDGVAFFPGNYMAACETGIFLLKNSKMMIPCPKTYAALKNALHCFCEGPSLLPWRALVMLVYLEEHGLLPQEIPSGGGAAVAPEQGIFLRSLCGAAAGDCKFSRLSEKAWKKLEHWIESVAGYYEL